MKIFNPNYIEPVSPGVQSALDELTAFFTANPNVKSVTFDQVRGQLNKTPEELPDGFIQQAAQNAGYKVE